MSQWVEAVRCQPSRAFALCFALLVAACSSSGTSAPAPADAAVDTTPDAPAVAVDPNAVVGRFSVRLMAATPEAPSHAVFTGQVDNGPIPELYLWTVVREEAGCILRTPSVPFCAGGCSGGACVKDDQCAAYPNATDVGTVTLKLGPWHMPLLGIAGAYQPPGGMTFPSPPCPEGEDVELTATGGAYGPFALKSACISPLVLLGPASLPAQPMQPLVLDWEPPQMPGRSRIEVMVDVSHHGGKKGDILCNVPDNGHLEISAAMMDALIALGAAGFPSVYVVRATSGEAQLRHGRVLLRSESAAERPLDIPGVQSCRQDLPCPAGKTCQRNYRCQ